MLSWTITVRACIFTSLIFHFKVCFAYLGPINPVLGVTYKFYDKTTLTTSSATNYLTIANAEASTTWVYKPHILAVLNNKRQLSKNVRFCIRLAQWLFIITFVWWYRWNYVCVNVVDELSKLKPDGSSFEARKLVVYRNNSAVDPLLVDAVIVVRSSLATDTKGTHILDKPIMYISTNFVISI